MAIARTYKPVVYTRTAWNLMETLVYKSLVVVIVTVYGAVTGSDDVCVNRVDPDLRYRCIYLSYTNG